MKTILPPAHGGSGLVNRILPELEKDTLPEKLSTLKTYIISNSDLSMFYRMADGGLSPLEGPMDSRQFYRVLDEEVIEKNGKKYAWTIPIAFPVSKKDAEELEIGETVFVKNEAGEVVGTLEISDIYPFDKNRYNTSVYGTERTDHPGAKIVLDDSREYLLGGKIWAYPQPKPLQFGKFMLTPLETRTLFRKRGWERIIAFQTRNPLHRAHEYAIVYGLEKLTKEGFFAGAVLNPLVGATKSDDIPADVRMRTYKVLLEEKLIGSGDRDLELWERAGYALDDQLLLIGLDVKMFYGGPKEAIMHAIYRQNYGFTDIIIGRKHADAPFDDGTSIWGDFDAQEKFNHLNGELLIKPLNVGFAAYFEEIGRVGLMEEFQPKGYHIINISGKELRRKLKNNEVVDNRVMREPVAQILKDYYRSAKRTEKETIKSTHIKWHETGITKQDREKRNGHRGIVIWLTGLSGSGKSTIAVELQAQLFERGCQVYILDGDNIRHGLNRDLGFSPKDREQNIRRIGEVAKLFVNAGTIIITSFISPYREDRDWVRGLLAPGDFAEVYVNAPLAVCEERDTKGLYKKARRGEIQEFTGISAPYEPPLKPELEIRTDQLTVEKSAERIMAYLKNSGVI